MKEEDTLLKKIGKEHSFKVPDGYFENLTSEVMNHKPVADDIAVAVTAMEADTEQVSDEMIDVALDRAMLDDYSLYVYLSDASVE